MCKTVRTTEMKLKHNSFKTILKLFCFSFISLCRQLNSEGHDGPFLWATLNDTVRCRVLTAVTAACKVWPATFWIMPFAFIV